MFTMSTMSTMSTMTSIMPLLLPQLLQPPLASRDKGLLHAGLASVRQSLNESFDVGAFRGLLQRQLSKYPLACTDRIMRGTYVKIKSLGGVNM